MLYLLLKPYRGFSKTTWKFLASGFVNASCLTLTIYLTLYLNSLEFSSFRIGWVVTLFSLGGLCGGYLGGYLTDKYSSLSICKLSLVISSCFLFLVPMSKNFYFLSLIVILLGLFSSLFRPAFILSLTDGEKVADLEKIIALRRVAINLGMAFGAGFFGLIVSGGYQLLFIVIGLANLIAFAILLSVTTTTSKEKSSRNDLEDKGVKNNGLYFFLILMFCTSLIFNQTQITYPLFLKDNLNFSVSFISFLFLLNGILIAILQIPITTYLSCKNTNYTCAIGVFLVSLGLCIVPLCTSAVMIVISCVIWTIGEIIFFPAILALIIKLSGDKKGKNIGLYQLFFSLASSAAPALGSISYGYNVNSVWYASGVLGIIMTLYFLLSVKKTETDFVKFSTLEKGL